MTAKGTCTAKLAILMIVVALALLSAGVMAEGTSEDLWVRVDVTDAAVTLDGLWLQARTPEAFNASERVSNRTNTTAEFTFEGTGVRWVGATGQMRGQADVYLNGELVEAGVDTYAPASSAQVILYSITGLPEGTQTLRIVPTGGTHEDATGIMVVVDAFDYVPTLAGAVDIAQDVLAAAPVGEPQLGSSLARFYPSDVADSLAAVIAEAAELDAADAEDTIAALLSQSGAAQTSLVSAVFPDKSGHGNHAVVAHGSPVWSEGRFGHGITITDGTDLVVVEDFLVGNTHTVEFWVHMPETPQAGWVQMLGFVGASTDRSPGIWKHANENQRLHIRYNPGNMGFNDVGPAGEGTDFAPDAWYHLALVKEGANLDLYVNGEFVANVEVPEEIVPAERLVFGRRLSVFDELRVWDTARSADEIKAYFDQPLTGAEDGLIGYWSFNDLQL